MSNERAKVEDFKALLERNGITCNDFHTAAEWVEIGYKLGEQASRVAALEEAANFIETDDFPLVAERSVFNGEMQNHHWHPECLEDCKASNDECEYEFSPYDNERPKLRGREE